MTNPANNPNESELDIGVQSQYVNPLGSANLTRLDVQQATAKTPQQAEFDRQQEAVEREYQRQREIAKEEFQRQQESADRSLQRRKDFLLFLLAIALILMITGYAISILQNPNHSPEEDKFATSILIAITTGVIGFVTGRTVIVK